MRYGVRDVFELKIFDTDGNLLAFLDTLTESGIYILQDEKSSKRQVYIKIKDALLNTDVLKILSNEKEPKQLTDYQKELGVKEKRKFSFNQIFDKELKLIAKGLYRREDNKVDEEVIYEIPLVRLAGGLELATNNIDPSAFDLVFKAVPDENGDLFDLML